MAIHSDKWNVWKLWYDFIKQRWLYYVLGIFSLLLSNTTSLMTPKVMGWVIDLLNKDPLPTFLNRPTDLERFYLLFYILIFISIVLMLSRVGWHTFLLRQTTYASKWLRTKVWDHVRFFPQDKLDQEYNSGLLMSASNSDVHHAGAIFGKTILEVIYFLSLSSLIFLFMFWIDQQITLLTLALFLLIPVLIKMLAKLEKEQHQDAQHALAKFNEKCSQAIATIKLQRITQTGRFWNKRLIASAKIYRNRRLSAMHISLRWSLLMGAITVISYIFLFALGMRKVFSDELTVGDFIVIQSYLFFIKNPLLALGNAISEWQRGKMSLNRLATIYNEDQDLSFNQSNDEIIESETIFEVADVSFKYPEGERTVFEDISFTLKKGQRLGITGTLGSGKTTLINLLSGLERNFEGRIHFFGQDIRSYGHQSLRKYSSIVSQRPFLFADSIRNNLRLDENVSEEDLWNALYMVGLKSEIEQLPDGLDTFLGERGTNLSGGQKQRLTLARALATKPKLLFLDDCMSAVDMVTEDHIIQEMNKNLKDTTIIWIAHRKSTLKYCDTILDMSQ